MLSKMSQLQRTNTVRVHFNEDQTLKSRKQELERYMPRPGVRGAREIHGFSFMRRKRSGSLFHSNINILLRPVRLHVAEKVSGASVVPPGAREWTDSMVELSPSSLS